MKLLGYNLGCYNSSPYRLLPHIAMPMCDKIHHLWITSNDLFYKTNSFVFKPKDFWMLHLNNHFYIQNHVFFCGQRIFRVSPEASHAFLHFHELPPLEICIATCSGSFTPRGCLSLFAITRQIYSFSCKQPCDSVGLHPTISSPPINHQTQC